MKNALAARRQSRLLLALHVVVLAVALALRLPAIINGGPQEGRGDEWYTGWRSLQPMFERGNPGNFMHPGLFYEAGGAFYALIYAVGRVTGAYADSADFLAVFVRDEQRFLTWLLYLVAVFGALTANAVLELGRRLFNVRAGAVAAAIVVLSPSCIDASQRLRVDSLAALTVATAGVALLSLYERGTRSAYAVAGVAVGLAMSANYPGALLLLPLVWTHWLRTKRPSHGASSSHLGRLLLALVSALLTFILTNPYLLLQPKHAWNDFTFQLSLAGRLVPYHIGEHPAFYLHAFLAEGVLLASVSAVAIAWVLWRRPGFARMMAIQVLLHFAIFSGLVTKFERYILPAVVWLCVLAGGLFDELAQARVQGHAQRALKGAAVGALLALLLFQTAEKASPLINARREGKAAVERERLQSWLLTNAPAGSTVWVESDVLPLMQATFADRGGALQTAMKGGVHRVYPAFDARVLKGTRVERRNFDPVLVTGGQIDYALTCDRDVRDAQHPRPELVQQQAFYAALERLGTRVYESRTGCWISRITTTR